MLVDIARSLIVVGILTLPHTLHINPLIQPSLKLKSQTRHGARVTKEAPLTRLERVLQSASVPEADKRRPGTQVLALDPLDHLSRQREAQQHVAKCSESGTAATEAKHLLANAGFLGFQPNICRL
ncbi:hypothetical protein ACLKMY_20945 [Paraburkholderia mimosarum]|uniref:hypothetical protein n=1 Tax=Paraburkholderia mimosarum TaxID=312026 RepID=UPI0039C09204